jgi:hypothetical protein
MNRCFALTFTAISCACGSPSATAPDAAPALVIVHSPEADTANSTHAQTARSTVPMTDEDQKIDPLDAIARAVHVYWFFGSR